MTAARGSGRALRPVVVDVRHLLSVPGPWVLAGLCLMSAVSTVLGLHALGSPAASAAALAGVPLLSGLLGALGAGADLRHGTVHVQVLALGSRSRYVLRAVRGAALVSAASAAVAVVAANVLVRLLGPPGPGFDAPVRGALLAALVAVCWAAVGVASAVLLGSQTAAVGVLLGYGVLAEPMLEAVSSSSARWLPGTQSVQLLAAGPWTSVLGPAARLVLVAGLLTVVALAVLARRPVRVTAS